jgi:hypothetical protein
MSFIAIMASARAGGASLRLFSFPDPVSISLAPMIPKNVETLYTCDEADVTHLQVDLPTL